MSNEKQINRRTFNAIAQQVLSEAILFIDNEVEYNRAQAAMFESAEMPERVSWCKAKVAQAENIRAGLFGMYRNAEKRQF